MLRRSLRVLLLCMHLKIHNISLVLGKFLAFVHIDLGSLRYEPHVVRYHYDATLELLQAPRQSIDALRVEEFVARKNRGSSEGLCSRNALA
jgi:hypothetical protein